MKCAHIIVTGKVQGVFFRDNTRKKAAELGLTGYVKNMPDGDVEIVAEGDENKINELVKFVEKGPGIARVAGVKVKHKEPENFKGFEMKY